MFKNLTLYRIAPGWNPSLTEMEAALDDHRFAPCSASQDKAVGWVEPRGEAHGPLVESVDQQRILKLQIESKAVPGAVVRKKAQEAADQIEATTGRKPGKKETKALREDARQALLPMAFARQQNVWVWIDPGRGWLVTDASSQGKNDEVITALVDAFPGMAVSLLNTQMTPQSSMARWLSAADPEEWPDGLAVERECELRSTDEERSVVRFTRHHLLTDEVRRHVAEGKLPTRLAMSWEGRVGFVLTESMALRKIAFLEGVFEDRPANEEESFDSNVAIGTGELRQVLDALIEALGGELLPGQAPALPSLDTASAAAPVTSSASPADDGPPF